MRWTLLLPPNWVKTLSTLGVLGFLGKAPGTNGSFAGLIWYSMIFHFLSPAMYALVLIFSIILAVAICEQAEIIFAQKDPSFVILDEFVAMPVCFMGLQQAMSVHPMWIFMVLGFLFFRFFDILKPLGIKKLQNLPGGRGVVYDDIAAAIATCVCLHIINLNWTSLFRNVI